MVRCWLSVVASRKIAIPPLAYPSKVHSINEAESLSAPLLMARWILSFGMLTPLAFEIATLRRGLPSGSGPPSFTATVISLTNLENTFERFESMPPFLRLMVDHLLCPDI